MKAEPRLRVWEFASRAEISIATFHAWRRAGTINTVKIGPRRLVPARELVRIMAAKRKK